MENPEILLELRRIRALLQTQMVILAEMSARETDDDLTETIDFYRIKYESFVESENPGMFPER